MTTTTKSPEIAATLHAQLGAMAFRMMGAKNLIDTGRGLTWKIGANAKKVTHLMVELDPSDTYTVTFLRVTKRGLEVKTVAEFSGVYVSELRRTIENGTGLYLSL